MELQRVPSIAKYLSVVFLFAWIGRSTVWNFLPIFFENHMSVFWVGVATSLPPLVTLMFDIPVGNLVQHAGEKVVIFLGLLVAIFPPLLYYVAVPATLVFGKAVEGVAKLFLWNGGWSLSLKSSSDEVESETVSIFLLGVNLALIVGPVIGGFLIAANGFGLTFGLWVFTSLVALLVYFTYVGVEREDSLSYSFEEVVNRNTYVEEFSDLKGHWSSLKLPFSLIFLYSIIFSFYWMAVPLLLEKVSGDFQVMGLVFGAAALPKAFQFLLGDLADRVGKQKTLIGLSLVLTPVLVLMNFLSQVLFIGIFFFVARSISSGMSPAIHAIFDSACPDELEGEFVGFNQFFKHSGMALGPIMAGTIASLYGINASFLAAGFISFLIFLLTGYSLYES